MRESVARGNRMSPLDRWTAGPFIITVWLTVVALAVAKLRRTDGIIVALAGLAASGFTVALLHWGEQRPLAKSDQEGDAVAP